MKLFFLTFSILILALTIQTVYADADDVNVLDFPKQLSERLTIPLFAAQILASLIIMSFFLLPTLLLTRGQSVFAPLVIGIGSVGFCVAIGWFPVWLFVLICMLIALMYAFKTERFF